MLTSWLYQNDKNLTNNALPAILAEAREKKVESLDLSKNNFTNIQFLAEQPLPDLKVLDISYNQTEIAEIVIPATLFPDLEYLYMYKSNIKSIRFEGNFPKLNTLHLAENKLETFELPQGFAALETLYLYKNLIKNIPKEVFDKGQQNVWEGVRNVLKYDQSQISYLQEGKMLLIGNGKVGKTSIRLKLINKEAILPEIADRTQGIEQSLSKYKVKNIDDNELYVDKYKVKNIDFSLHIWDFGGQGKYREVQQLFCSRKSLYLFVTAHDDEPTHEDYVGFEYWLSMANAFSYDKESQKYSPVIHVLNKIEEKDNGTNEIGLKKDFPNIHKFVKISCKDLENFKLEFDNLEKAIAETLPKVSEDIFKTPFPNPWLAVKKDLEGIEEKGKTHILYTEYLLICSPKNIDESEAKTLIETLDLMGYLVYYGENPLLKDWIILNPRWVKDAIYKVLDSTLIRKGEFYENLFPIIWKEYNAPEPHLIKKLWGAITGVKRDYTSDEHKNLLHLMLAYEFCYEQTDGEGKPFYIIPALFGKKPPINAHLQTFDYEIRFMYQPFIPAGTVNKLIVRLHKDIYGEYKWKNGVILHDLATNSFAEVTEIWKEKAVYICLKGQNVEVLYDLIFQTLETLNQDLKKTKFLASLYFKVEAYCKNKWRSLEDIKDFGEDKKFSFLFGNSSENSENLHLKIKQSTNMSYNIRIKKALKAIDEASNGVYFEEMNAVMKENTVKITTAQKNTLSRFERRFINGDTDFEFPEQLESFTKQVRKYLLDQDDIEIQLQESIKNLPATTKQDVITQISEVKEVKGNPESSKARQIFNKVMEKLSTAGITVGASWAMGLVLQSLGIDKETLTTFMEVFKVFSDSKE